jgi:tyrosine-protein kinase Etk/Wzc
MNSAKATETIDFRKLRMIARNNWIVLVVILIITNGLAITYVRYTKELYESESEIKLDIKQDATELGIREFVPERKQANVISAEIETIKSKLFLSRVVDSLNLKISYLSLGKFLNTELHKDSPFQVNYTIHNPALFNTIISIDPLPGNAFRLNVPGYQNPVSGIFGTPVHTPDFSFTLELNPLVSFHPDNKYAFVIHSHESALNYLLKNLTVEPLNVNANTIRVAFKDNNPYKAQYIVNGIDSIYLRYSYTQKNLANQQKIDWLNSELERIEEQLESFENYLENFTLRNRTNNLPEEMKRMLAQINRLDSQRYELNRRITEINRLTAGLQSGDYLLPVGLRNLLPAEMLKQIEKLQDLQIQTSRLTLSYHPETVAFRQIEQEVSTLQKKLMEQLGELKSGWLIRLNELTRLQSQLEASFSTMPGKNTQLNKQSRYYKLYEEFYLSLMQKKSEFEITMAGSTPDFKILSTATLPTEPISPKKWLVYAAGFAGSAALCLFFLGFMYIINDRITSVVEIEKFTSLPILGVVPAFRPRDNSILHLVDHPRSMVAEALRSLRTNLDFFAPDIQKKVVAVTSTISGEGKSFLALNLGAALALTGKKVLLLDMDMRKTNENKFRSNHVDEVGLSTVLIGKSSWKDCLQAMPLENFHLLPPGPRPPNPAELLMNNRFTRLVDDLKQSFDIILIDTPPVGLVTDGIMALKVADVGIFVFRANYSRIEFFQNLQRMLRIHTFSHITAVLNAFPVTSQEAYGYGYYEEIKKRKIRNLFRRSV